MEMKKEISGTGYAFYFLSRRKQAAYRDFLSGILRHEPSIGIFGLSAEEVNQVLKAVLTDVPGCFWFEGKWELYEAPGAGHQASGSGIEPEQPGNPERASGFVRPLYTFSPTDSRAIRERIGEVCAEIHSAVKDRDKEIEQVRYIFDWLLDHVSYGVSDGRGQTICDALVNRAAVCKGTSKALQYILLRMNIFSTLKEGTLDGLHRHVWNVVRTDGKYYNTDVSMGYDCFSYLFDDSRQNDRYRCFSVSDARLSKTHRTFQMPWSSLDCLSDHPGGS